MSDELAKEILTVKEAADLLGVSPKTFQKVLRTGTVPGRKIGREWKFSRQALIDWVGSGCSRDFLDAADEEDTAPAPRSTATPAAARRAVPRRGEDRFFAEED